VETIKNLRRPMCFSKTCPYRFDCIGYREENPSCNEDYRESYCGTARTKDFNKEEE